MIEKIENPLGLTLEGIEILITELQQQFDQFVKDPIHETLGLSLEESGVAIEIKTKSKKRYSYNLEQLKLLKAEILDLDIKNPMSLETESIENKFMLDKFSIGQAVVYIDDFMPNTVEIITGKSTDKIIFNHGSRSCIPEMLRPATTIEIKNKKRSLEKFA